MARCFKVRRDLKGLMCIVKFLYCIRLNEFLKKIPGFSTKDWEIFGRECFSNVNSTNFAILKELYYF
jgi:hypothetical protein